MSYRDLAELRLAAAHHFAPLGGHAHFNCTLCQVAIRERVRQEQLARRLPYDVFLVHRAPLATPHYRWQHQRHHQHLRGLPPIWTLKRS